METCLVTGGAGFIGSHIVDELINLGYNVVVVDNESADSNSQFYYNDRAGNYKIDILSGNLKSIFVNHQIDYIFHLAAEARVQPSIENPMYASEVNFMGTGKLLELARQFYIKKFIYSSTSSAYGPRNRPPYVEDMPTDCLTAYSVGKVGGENLCKVYNNLYDVKTVIFRYFNVYGERQPLKGHYAPVIGKFMLQAERGEPMTIVGEGKQRRDFTYIKDVVAANILALKSSNEKIYGEIINIGTGVNHSMIEIAEMIGGDYMHTPARRGEVFETKANNSKAYDLLGWEPTIRLQDWIRKNKRNRL